MNVQMMCHIKDEIIEILTFIYARPIKFMAILITGWVRLRFNHGLGFMEVE